jgi:hypothetical protein
MREEALVDEISEYADDEDFGAYDDYDEDLTDEELLGAATLAKIREAEDAVASLDDTDAELDYEEE